MKSTILFVDDHAIVRHGLAALVETTTDLISVGEAEDGRQAIDMARELQPDLVVMDLLMPGMGGAAALRPVQTVSPASKVLVLTSSEDSELAFTALEAGAHAFLLKSMSGREILDAIRRVRDGEIVIPPAITQSILRVVRQIRRPESSPYTGLSERELDVLRALANGASNARLAELLSISVKTVKSHIGSILAKLNLTDRTEAVAFAWRHGLMQDQTATGNTSRHVSGKR